MFDLGWGELLLIGVVALIVVGPKDLPMLFRQIGRFTGKARGMAREFSRAMEAAADEAGVKDIDRTIRAAADPMKSASSALRDLTGLKTPAKPAAPAPGAATAAPGSATADLAAKRAGERVAAAETAAARAPLPLTDPAPAAPAATPLPAAAEPPPAEPTEDGK